MQVIAFGKGCARLWNSLDHHASDVLAKVTAHKNGPFNTWVSWLNHPLTGPEPPSKCEGWASGWFSSLHVGQPRNILLYKFPSRYDVRDLTRWDMNVCKWWKSTHSWGVLWLDFLGGSFHEEPFPKSHFSIMTRSQWPWTETSMEVCTMTHVNSNGAVWNAVPLWHSQISPQYSRHPIARPAGRGMGCLLWFTVVVQRYGLFVVVQSLV